MNSWLIKTCFFKFSNVIRIMTRKFSLNIRVLDDDTDTTDDNDLDGFKWIQDWYEVFFGVTVGQFFSDNLRLCAFIHHGKISPFGCTTVIVLIKHHRFHHMRLCCPHFSLLLTKDMEPSQVCKQELDIVEALLSSDDHSTHPYPVIPLLIPINAISQF